MNTPHKIVTRYGVSAGCHVTLTIDPSAFIRRWHEHTTKVNRDATGGAVPYSPRSWERFVAWAEQAIAADVVTHALDQIVSTGDVVIEEGALAADLFPPAAFHELMDALGPQPGPGQMDIFGRVVA